MYCHICNAVLLFATAYGKIVPQHDPQESPLILTPYIESGETDKAKQLSAVDPSLFADVNSHAAYFTVNETNKWHQFFWYFPAEGVPLDSTPLIIWLQGGPGGSSLYGLFDEIGPIQYINGKVERRTLTWGSNYSLLFIDNPVGAGFSFSEDPDKFVSNENQVGECLLSFLQQFLQVFPELRKAPLFIAGESYAGKYIPAFGHYIHHSQNSSMPINLKGLAIGDGLIDPPTMMHYSELALQLGLVDPEQAEEIHQHEEDARKHWDEQDLIAFSKGYAATLKLLKQYAPISVYNYLLDPNDDFEKHSPLLNREDIQEALHVKRMHYISSNHLIHKQFYMDEFDTVKPWLEELLEHYGVMCYNGQLDVLVAYALSVHTYRTLKWSGQQAYLNAARSPLYHEADANKVNSFVKASGNFLDVMVRGAGHMVPADQPQAAMQIIDMFINKFK